MPGSNLQDKYPHKGFKLFKWPFVAKRPIWRLINENKFCFDIKFASEIKIGLQDSAKKRNS